MKIEKVETAIHDVEFLPNYVRKQLFVKITTGDGLIGIGEAWTGAPPAPVLATVRDLLTPQIRGEDSRRIEFLWQKMHRAGYRYGTEGVVQCAISGVDLALWDLLGKYYNVPTAHLLGGTVKQRLRVYASFPAFQTPERLTINLERMMKAGFTAVKLHDLNEKIIARCREVVGEDFTIMLDPHGSWSYQEAEKSIRCFEKYNLLWVEEPVFPMQDHASIERLARRSSMHFAAGENEYSLDGFFRLMKSGAVDYIQPEIAKAGGLTIAKKVAVLCELFNFTLCPHCYLVGPAFYAGIQLGFTQQHMDWHELKWMPNGFDKLAIPPPKVVDGYIELPNAPGLGFTEPTVKW
ncbi:MAG: mandelate racemase/muconate lactonizing enzyme family protein [Gammaproteobacteria bacterium]|nr:mandelate racemase/muconate lactonizing enzyme family protein [Gammaproteobacteria bacterium]